MTKRECLRRIHQIIESKKDSYLNNSSLLSGYAGVLLFLVYYQQVYPSDSNKKLISRIVEQLVSEINFDNLRYSDGVSGILWSLNHLEEKFGYKLGIKEYIIRLADELCRNKEELILDPSLDFLHGLLGIHNLLGRLNDHEFNDLMDRLVIQNAVRTQDGTYWLESLGSEKKIINTSLAHGQASFLIYLAYRIPNLNKKRKEEIIELLSSAVTFYNTIELVNSNSLYPSIVVKNEFSRSSRLAWCYGDLGIAVAQLYASSVLKDGELQMKAICLAINSTDRKKRKETGILDQGFCHGSAGVSHLYSYLYRNTGMEIFDVASEFWMNHTLKNLFKEEGIYKADRGDDGFQESYGLLDGLSGIGLCLVGNIFPDLNSWEEAFYLKSVQYE